MSHFQVLVMQGIFVAAVVLVHSISHDMLPPAVTHDQNMVHIITNEDTVIQAHTK